MNGHGPAIGPPTEHGGDLVGALEARLAAFFESPQDLAGRQRLVGVGEHTPQTVGVTVCGVHTSRYGGNGFQSTCDSCQTLRVLVFENRQRPEVSVERVRIEIPLIAVLVDELGDRKLVHLLFELGEGGGVFGVRDGVFHQLDYEFDD